MYSLVLKAATSELPQGKSTTWSFCMSADLSSRLAGSVRFAGGAVAVAIYGSIIHQKTANDIAPKVAAAALHAGLPASEVESFIGIGALASPSSSQNI